MYATEVSQIAGEGYLGGRVGISAMHEMKDVSELRLGSVFEFEGV